MRIRSIRLENIKKFGTECIYNFDTAEKINTISGKNGSGKSTIFECAMLCQKAYFVTLLKERNIDIADSINDEISVQLYSMSVKKGAYIELELRLYKTDFSWSINSNNYISCAQENGKAVYDVHVLLKVDDVLQEKVVWSIEIDEGKNDGIISKFWNLQNPSHIIVYLDADKTVYEDDFTFKKISMMSEEEINPIVNFALHPKKVYQNMYDTMMNAYVYQRINPQTPKKDIFLSESKEMFHDLIKGISISNFSGKERKDQFVLIAKGKTKYDVRNLSSGEKLVWYTLLILNYVKKIGVLVIDEPENHLHEELAWNFIRYLKRIIKNEFSDLTLGQVFLITHAKNLIYNNFSDGKNYVLDENGRMSLIEKENCEDILRECGISYIDDRVLFVEGKTESENLKSLCEESNIRIRELANCSEIIQVYTSLVKVKELVYAPKFLFVVDRDTREDLEIEKLRNLDTQFFDKHFLVLPVHEFENFFIDERIIAEASNAFVEVTHGERVEQQKVLEIMKKYADESLLDTKKKYINNSVREEIKRMASLVKQKDIDISNKANYEKYIDSLFRGKSYSDIIRNIKEKYICMDERYGMLNWLTNWKKVCDGKRVYSQSIVEIAKDIGVTPANLNKKVFEISKECKDSELRKFWENVKSKLK